VVGSKEAIIVLKNLMKLFGMTNIQVDMYCQVIFNCYNLRDYSNVKGGYL